MKRHFAAAAFAALLAVAACGSSGGSPGAGDRQPAGSSPPVSNPAPDDSGTGGERHGKATITIKDFGYAGNLTVEPGEDVTVLNEDSTAHTLTDEAGKLFDTGIIAGGGSRSFVAPMKPGTYPFGCTLHPEMSGVLTVTG
jgi:plastocyanin